MVCKMTHELFSYKATIQQGLAYTFEPTEDDEDDAVTVYTIVVCEGPERRDLNADGDPCTTRVELIELINLLHSWGAFSDERHQELLDEAA